MTGNFKYAKRRFGSLLLAGAVVSSNALHSIVYYGAATSLDRRVDIKRMGHEGGILKSDCIYGFG